MLQTVIPIFDTEVYPKQANIKANVLELCGFFQSNLEKNISNFIVSRPHAHQSWAAHQKRSFFIFYYISFLFQIKYIEVRLETVSH